MNVRVKLKWHAEDLIKNSFEKTFMGTVFQKLKIYSQEREFSRNGNCIVAEIAVVTKISFEEWDLEILQCCWNCKIFKIPKISFVERYLEILQCCWNCCGDKNIKKYRKYLYRKIFRNIAVLLKLLWWQKY